VPDGIQPSGIEKILPIGSIDAEEKTLLAAAVKELGPSIEKVRTSFPFRPYADSSRVSPLNRPNSEIRRGSIECRA
jgi:hypothetical protein